jgi:hypothetical protein
VVDTRMDTCIDLHVVAAHVALHGEKLRPAVV